MHDGVIGPSRVDFFLRSSPKRDKVKISLHVDCHEVNTYGGTDIVAEFRAAVIGWVKNWGTEMLLLGFSSLLFSLSSSIIHPNLFSVLFPYSLHK